LLHPPTASRLLVSKTTATNGPSMGLPWAIGHWPLAMGRELVRMRVVFPTVGAGEGPVWGGQWGR
jgi:hypothetical protein